jgi:hypothetical protein
MKDLMIAGVTIKSHVLGTVQEENDYVFKLNFKRRFYT